MSYEHHYTPPQDQERDELPLGWHNFEVVAAFNTSLTGEPLETVEGVPFVKLRCLPDGFNAPVTYSLFLEAKNARKLDAFLWATGLGDHGEPVDWKPQTLEGLKFSGKVAKNSYQGATFDKIVRLQPVVEKGNLPTIGDDLRPENKADKLPF